jgi:Ca-activated chloride channel family protein
MKFLWPEMLWLLLLLPALVGGYLYLLRRKQQVALRYPSLSMVKAAIGTEQKYRRHIPPLLFLLALTALFLAIARPAAVVGVVSQQGTIILAMDVSSSMRATDMKPDRITAAQNAAKAFIKDQPSNVRIGIVSFAGTASVVQAPTQDREDLIAAIDRFQLQRATAIGSGIIVSLATIFPDAGIDENALMYERVGTRGVSLDHAGKTEKKELQPVPPGSYTSAAIILLSDGEQTSGPDAIEAAQMAAARGVRIYTVGFGRRSGENIVFGRWSMRVRLDEETLKRIADLTRGEYFFAGSATDLRKVYDFLSSRFIMEKKETEITAFFGGAAAVAALISGLLSLLWFNRIF